MRHCMRARSSRRFGYTTARCQAHALRNDQEVIGGSETLRYRCRHLTPTRRRGLGAMLSVGLLALVALLLPSPVRAVRTDIVILNNDDRITGDIKSLERGMLKLKTDAADNILIQWEDIKRLISTTSFEVESTTGRRYFGSFPANSGTRKLHIVGVLDSLVIDFDKIVYIVPIEDTFWSRIDGSVDLGLSYTQANLLLKWSFAGEIRYRAPSFYSRLSVNSSISEQENVSRTSRQDMELRNTRFFRHKTFTNLIYSMMSNDELGVAMRISLNGSGGADWLKTNSMLWGGYAGLSVTTEQSTTGPDFTTQLEATFNMEFETFAYHTPKRDISVVFSVIPNLTDRGRVRTELNVKFKWEIVADLFFALTALNSTDNRPPEGASSNSDLTLTTSIGYSF